MTGCHLGENAVQQLLKQFTDELNKSLDSIGAPPGARERAAVLSKMFHIPKQQAWALLEGHLFPDKELLARLAEELEFDVKAYSENK